jgi:hypothetical protein
MKTSLPLGLALAGSILLNIALLRREPRAAAPPPAPAPVERPSPAAVEVDADQILLREEVRLLRNQLAVAKTRLELERNAPGFSVIQSEQPETRDFEDLLELVQSFIEFREAESRDEQGRLARIPKAVLTPGQRDGALRAVEDYLGLDGAARLTFHEGATSAIDAYRRIVEAYNGEILAAAKAGENDEFFEDDARRRSAVMERMNRRSEEWARDHVKPVRDFLDRRDGIRPSLLSHHLSNLLAQLGNTEER